jgi:periplasmic protein TonB
MSDSGNNRVFHYAILASLVLHALLLLGFPDLIEHARRAVSFPAPLIARLMEPEAAAPVPPPPMEKVEPPKPAPRLAKPVPKAPQPAPVDPTPVVEQPAPPVESPPPPVPVPAPPVAAAAPQPAAPTTPPTATLSAAPSAEVQSRDQYRLQLIDEARRHKRYPALARDNNWEGVVGISVAVAAGGRPSVALKSSSGYEVIDRQALEMFRAAANAVPVPPALRGSAFALDLRIRYNLED